MAIQTICITLSSVSCLKITIHITKQTCVHILTSIVRRSWKSGFCDKSELLLLCRLRFGWLPSGNPSFLFCAMSNGILSTVSLKKNTNKITKKMCFPNAECVVLLQFYGIFIITACILLHKQCKS